MNLTMDMMKGAMAGMDMPMKDVDMDLMQECLEALSACMQACTMCADADAGEGMGRCASLCANCADLCDTTMRMMLRTNGWDMAVMMRVMDACLTMCRSCSAECETHADMSEHCRMCMMACDQAAMSLDRMMDAMQGVMPAM